MSENRGKDVARNPIGRMPENVERCNEWIYYESIQFNSCLFIRKITIWSLVYTHIHLGRYPDGKNFPLSNQRCSTILHGNLEMLYTISCIHVCCKHLFELNYKEFTQMTRLCSLFARKNTDSIVFDILSNAEPLNFFYILSQFLDRLAG